MADFFPAGVEILRAVPTTGWSGRTERSPDQEGMTMKYLLLIHQHRGAREQFASFTPTMQAEGLAAYQPQPTPRWSTTTAPTPYVPTSSRASATPPAREPSTSSPHA